VHVCLLSAGWRHSSLAGDQKARSGREPGGAGEARVGKCRIVQSRLLTRTTRGQQVSVQIRVSAPSILNRSRPQGRLLRCPDGATVFRISRHRSARRSPAGAKRSRWSKAGTRGQLRRQSTPQHLATSGPSRPRAVGVDGCDGERGVAEERGHGLDRGAGVASELRGGMAEDMEPGRGQPCRLEVPPEPRVERGARGPLDGSECHNPGRQMVGSTWSCTTHYREATRRGEPLVTVVRGRAQPALTPAGNPARSAVWPTT
jgi:hypothetical protein